MTPYFPRAVLSTNFSQPHGLSNGSEPPPNPPPPAFGGLVATGDCAEVQPPKSSSAATVGGCADLFAPDIGAPHPPAMSFGVIRDGTFPSSTVGAAGLVGAGSGAPQGLLSVVEPHGSNIGLLLCETAGGRDAATAGLGAGCEDRLNAELKSVLGLVVVGDAILGCVGDIGGAVGAACAGAGVDVQPPKSSLLNKSVGIAAAAGLAAVTDARTGGGEAGVAF